MTKPISIEAWFDGCVEPVNPGGHGAYGAIVKVAGEVVFSEGRYVGHGPTISNNVAEYCGVLAVLEEVRKYAGIALIYGDSKLVVNQLSGKWKYHGGLYLPYMRRAKEMLARGLWQRVGFEWVPREQNGECDALSKKVLRDRGVEFKIQPEMAEGSGDAGDDIAGAARR